MQSPLDPPTLREGKDLPQEALLALYGAVGWSAYTRDADGLVRAIQGSTWVCTAWRGPELLGLIRVLSDDVSILYVQDILVQPEHQRAGVGRQLLTAALGRFAHVRQKVLLTDDEPRQRAFYEAMGFRETGDLKRTVLRAFVRIEGVTLE